MGHRAQFHRSRSEWDRTQAAHLSRVHISQNRPKCQFFMRGEDLRLALVLSSAMSLTSTISIFVLCAPINLEIQSIYSQVSNTTSLWSHLVTGLLFCQHLYVFLKFDFRVSSFTCPSVSLEGGERRTDPGDRVTYTYVEYKTSFLTLTNSNVWNDGIHTAVKHWAKKRHKLSTH